MNCKQVSSRKTADRCWHITSGKFACTTFILILFFNAWTVIAQTRLDPKKSIDQQNTAPANDSQRLRLDPSAGSQRLSVDGNNTSQRLSLTSASQRLNNVSLRLNPSEFSQRLSIQQVGEAVAQPTRLSPSLTTTTAAVKRVETPLEKADRVALQGNFEQALDLYKKILVKESDSVAAHIGLGYVYMQLGNLNDAIQEFSSAIDIAPNNVEAKINLAVILYRSGDIEEAIEQYQQVLKDRKEPLPVVHYNLAMALAHSGRLDEAIEQYKLAIDLRKKNYPEALNNLGLIYEAIGDFDSAAKSFKQVIDVQQGKYPLAHYNLGRQYLRQRAYREAIAELELAIKQQPNYPEAYLTLGNTYLLNNTQPDKELELTQKAIEVFEKALEQRKNFYPLAHENLAIALAKKGDMAGSLTHYRIAFDQYRDQSPFAMRNLISSIGQQEELTLYIIHNEISRPGNPGNLFKARGAKSRAIVTEVNGTIGPEREILTEEDRKSLASIFGKYEELDSELKDRVDVRYCAGQAYFVSGNWAAALEEFAQAIKLSQGKDKEINQIFFSLKNLVCQSLRTAKP